MKKHIFKTFSILFTLGLFILSFSFSAYAFDLSYSGGSTSNATGATGSTSGYSLSVIDPTYGNNVGYRFSIVNKSGNLVSGSKVANIYLDNIDIGLSAYNSAQRFIVKSGVVANKKQLANDTKVTTTTTAQSCEYKAGDAVLNTAPSQDPDKIGAWIKSSANGYQNLTRVYVACGLNLNTAGSEEYVLIEPILRVKLANVITVATPTELAIYGASVSGGGQYNGANGNLSETGSETLWNLQNYINREFPNLLYVEENTGIYSAVSPISTGKYTYNQIIQNGYGCSVLSVSNVVSTTYTIKYDPNGGSGTMADTVVTYGKNETLRDNAFTRTGYTFNGWHVYRKSDSKWLYTLSDGSTGWYTKGSQPSGATLRVYKNGYQSGKASSVNGDIITLYAQWKPYKLTINYYSNYADTAYDGALNAVGADKNVIVRTSTLKYDDGADTGLYDYSYIGASTYLGKTGYNGTGNWGTTTSGGILVNQSTSFSTAQELASALGKNLASGDVNVNLYAQFATNTYLVSYNANGGSGAPAAQTKKHDVDLTLSGTIPTKDGYLFIGWSTSQDGASSYYPNGIYTENAPLTLYAQYTQYTEAFSVAFKGVGRTTIMVGDVFNPLNHLDKFDLPDGATPVDARVIYNNVPRDAENKATTVGTGYTVVYHLSLSNNTIGEYRLIVTVLDADDYEESLKGYIRFISIDHIDTLEENSKWREGTLKTRLNATLSVTEPTDDDAIEVWHFSPQDVQRIKDWVKECENDGKSREEQNKTFGVKFGECQIKGKYADESES